MMMIMTMMMLPTALHRPWPAVTTLQCPHQACSAVQPVGTDNTDMTFPQQICTFQYTHSTHADHLITAVTTIRSIHSQNSRKFDLVSTRASIDFPTKYSKVSLNLRTFAIITFCRDFTKSAVNIQQSLQIESLQIRQLQGKPWSSCYITTTCFIINFRQQMSETFHSISVPSAFYNILQQNL